MSNYINDGMGMKLLIHSQTSTVEVWECISTFIPHFTRHMITYPCWDWSSSVLVNEIPGLIVDLNCVYWPLITGRQLKLGYTGKTPSHVFGMVSHKQGDWWIGVWRVSWIGVNWFQGWAQVRGEWCPSITLHSGLCRTRSNLAGAKPLSEPMLEYW